MYFTSFFHFFCSCFCSGCVNSCKIDDRFEKIDDSALENKENLMETI